MYDQSRPFKLSLGIPNGFFVLKADRTYKRSKKAQSLYPFNTDTEMALKILLHGRYGIQESRVYNVPDYQNEAGGMQAFRTGESVEESINNFKKVWGCNINITRNKKGNLSPYVNVKRRQDG